MAADLLVFSIAMWWLRVVVGWTLLEVVLVRCVSSRSGCVSMSCGSYRTNVTNPSGLSAHLKRLLELSRLVTVVGSNDSREQGLDRSACDLPVGASTRLPGPRRPSRWAFGWQWSQCESSSGQCLSLAASAKPTAMAYLCLEAHRHLTPALSRADR